ncbi:MAG: HpcH/HpaI aldolase/citrate lyase family protein [Hyphomicrobium sp.]
MSYTLYPIRKQRLQRSYLAVPGSNPTMIERAHKSAADYVFLDCEDAVAPPDKEQARKNIIQALNDLDWKGVGKSVSVRINGLDTHYMYRDVVDIVEQSGSKLDTILVPKVGVPADVYTVETIVSQIEVAKGLPHKIGMEALIETPLGMANVEAIASANSRLESMHFGVADYSAFNKARTVVIGGLNPDYPGDQWHFPLSRMTVACRAFGLRPIDGPFGGIDDPDGFKAACRRGAALGMEGKWAIHPSQIELANEIYSPTAAEVSKAERILVALKEAAAQGKGAASLDGKMIDAASEKMANHILATAAAIKAGEASRAKS